MMWELNVSKVSVLIHFQQILGLHFMFDLYMPTSHLLYSCVHVLLIGDDVKEGDIRLIPGSYLWQGLVEIYLDGVWGTINRAYTNAAKVACRQLGYNVYGKIY